jgi:hypothetical protein
MTLRRCWLVVAVVGALGCRQNAQRIAPAKLGDVEVAGRVGLFGGTGSADVPSGVYCVCVDESRPVAVSCSVSDRALVVNGNAQDIIDYACMR